MERQLAYRFIEKIAYEFSNQSESHGAGYVCGVRFYMDVRMPIPIAYLLSMKFLQNRSIWVFLSFTARTLREYRIEQLIRYNYCEMPKTEFEICAKKVQFL